MSIVRGGSAAASTTAKGWADDLAAEFGKAIDAYREGFAKATSRVPVGEDENDRRLLAQLGMTLGVVYLIFLTLWMWATRLRWKPNA